MPDQFCEQFFEQNIDFPAEKKLLAKCEQNIEILTKIDPKASQPGDQSLFLATYCTVYVPYDGASATEPIFWSRIECTHQYAVYRSTTRTRTTRIDESKPLHHAKYRQNEAMPSKIQAKYR